MENSFYIRNVTPNDIDDLYELSQLVSFINLPNDRKLILEKIESSYQCFKSPDKDLSKNWYIFVLVNANTEKVIGVSMIHAQHGTEEEPHFYLSVDHEHKYSSTINTGFTHGTLKLGLETDGPSEIGGLVLHPDYRKNDFKLGKQISFVRFLYISMFSKRFKKHIHSELMPPLDENGNSPLWEAIGRRFMNMDYQEADVLSRNNKEFILSLFPSENIYMTLLPLEAREAIGQVGNDTLPVKKMLESIGFEYTNEVDPFDGGPHYQASQERIKPILESTEYEIELSPEKLKDAKNYLLTLEHPDFIFYSVIVKANKKGNKLIVEKSDVLKLDKIKKAYGVCTQN
jgi:arginine N-succinyltransferase